MNIILNFTEKWGFFKRIYSITDRAPKILELKIIFKSSDLQKEIIQLSSKSLKKIPPKLELYPSEKHTRPKKKLSRVAY